MEWDNTIGGTGYDNLLSAKQTADGGFILGGYSASGISGDKTEASLGSNDYWVIKLNSTGSIEWQNTIGTSLSDNLVSVVQCIDGGYLVGGYTTGGISGDKTAAAIGGKDYWILKLAPTGEIVWQKTIGGTGEDVLTNIYPVAGGGFVVSGYSNSGISGNKTEACIGGYDYWLMKINSVGTIQWQFTIGGTLNDYLMQTIRSTDGSYILAGYSSSGISGDKTEDCFGGDDYWILSMNGAGTILWQNTIGGSGGDRLTSVCELNTGGYILGGNSSSNISGDKSENSLNYTDYCWGCEHYYSSNGSNNWIIRIDATGNMIWENTYQSCGEYLSSKVQSVFQYEDNRIMLGGNSVGGCEKTESDEGNDYWLVSINLDGFIIWQQSLAGQVTYDYDEYAWETENGDNYLSSVFVTADGGFFVAGSSNGMAGNDKSESTIGGSYLSDYWVLKLGADICGLSPIYADVDGDGEGGEYLTSTCEYTAGAWVGNNNDCDDLNQTVNTFSSEICDGLDNNCDGSVDEGLIYCNPGPDITWNKTIGDAEFNWMGEMCNTSDGGMIAVGSTSTESPYTGIPDYDFTLSDVMVTKLDATGNIQWQKVIEAADEDNGIVIKQTLDGGYILGANTFSGISGEKTVANFGYVDIWLIKLNAAGDIIWQKSFGGTNLDEISSIEITPDNKFILGCSSYSGISGNKTEINFGSRDLWIIKLDESGNILWQNSIGGTITDENPHVICSVDGYIVGATSTSNIGVDKTEVCHGSDDYWILGLNSSGSIVWQNTIGGSGSDEFSSIALDQYNNIIACGSSWSDAHPDKIENSYENDYWIVKLDPAGNVIWENTIQAEDRDYATKVICMPDGGYLIGGHSNSEALYDKIEPHTNDYFDFYSLSHLYRYDWWIVKLDNAGNIKWQNTIGGNIDDHLTSLTLNPDEKIRAAGYSESFRSRDKSQDPNDGVLEIIEVDPYYEDEWTENYADNDFWFVELETEVCTPAPEVCNLYDDNCNGLTDEGVVESISISAAGPTTFCQGGSVILNAVYTGATLQWYKNGVAITGATIPSYTVTTKGNYTCKTTSACGTATSTAIFVLVNKNPVATITAAGPTSFCEGGSVTLNETPSAGCTYQWFKAGVTIVGATSTSYIATTAGNYKCQVTKTATGCLKLSNNINVTVPCKEENQNSPADGASGGFGISIYPNPNSGTFIISTISPPQVGWRVEIYNALGELIYSESLESQQHTIQLHNIPSGIYFVRVENGDFISEQKLIIE